MTTTTRRLAVAVALASLADAATFGLVTTTANLGGELNPIARGLFLSAGVLGVWAYKAVGVSLAVAGVCLIGRHLPRVSTATLSLFAAISLAAAASNLVYAA